MDSRVKRYIFIVLFSVTTCILITMVLIAQQAGIVDLTRKTGGIGCICHDFARTEEVRVWIEGPSIVKAGEVHEYTIFMMGGPSISGGFNVAAWKGKLYPADSSSKLMPTTSDSELTHAFPKLFLGGIVDWKFYYRAPNEVVVDTIYSLGNSTNNDGECIPEGNDRWNFGNEFVINVVDSGTNNIENHYTYSFKLCQNYPNPFNARTKIEFEIQSVGFVSLKVYDILGREVATLVNEKRELGKYEVEWNADAIASGLYYYTLCAGANTDVKKMVLIK